MLTVNLKCSYCSKPFHMNYKGVSVDAPKRVFDRVKCPSCGSAMYLDIAVRRAGKSTKVKRAEAAWAERVNKRAREMYSGEADSLVRSFDALTSWEKNTWEGRAAAELRAQGVTA